METTKASSNKKINETTFRLIFLIAAVFSIFAVLTIFIFLLIQGVPSLGKVGFFKFIFGTTWNGQNTDTFADPLTGQYGVLTMIVGTIYSTGGALFIGGILGFFTAVFLAKFCPKKVKGPLTQVVNLLAGIPSVVYGLFGIFILSPVLGRGLSPNGSGIGLLLTSLILGIMIMPTITSLCKTSIEAVDSSYYEGALALGATKEQAIFKVVVPAAKSGIFSAFVLGIGRALGETMAIVMISGNQAKFPNSLFSSFRTLTGNIVLEMADAGEFRMGALIGTGVVLFIFTLIIIVSFNLLQKREKTFRKKQALSKSPSRKNKPKKVKFIIKNPDITFSKEEIEKSRSTKYFVGKFAKGGRYLSYLTTAIGIAFLIAIISFVMARGLPHLSKQFLFSEFEYLAPPTIFPAIISTLMLIALTSIIAFPLGVFTAIYLSEYTKKGSVFVKIIRVAVETLGGIPSIVYGMFGAIFFLDILNMGNPSIYAGALTISLMIIPTTVRATEEALKSVPDSFREGSYALGSGKLRTIFKIVLPSALPGILAAIILGIGRIVSESAPVLFTMGTSVSATPKSFRNGGATLAVALYAFFREGTHENEAFATGCILIIIILALNILSTFLVGRLQRKLSGKSKKSGRNEPGEKIKSRFFNNKKTKEVAYE